MRPEIRWWRLHFKRLPQSEGCEYDDTTSAMEHSLQLSSPSELHQIFRAAVPVQKSTLWRLFPSSVVLSNRVVRGDGSGSLFLCSSGRTTRAYDFKPLQSSSHSKDGRFFPSVWGRRGGSRSCSSLPARLHSRSSFGLLAVRTMLKRRAVVPVRPGKA